MAFPKRNRTQDKQKKKHSISDSFRKFNPDKITGRGIKNFLIYNFYRIGCCLEALGRELADIFSRFAETAFEFFVRVGRSIWKFAKLLFDSFLEDLGEPIMLIGTVLSNIKSIRDTTKDDKDINTTQEITKYINIPVTTPFAIMYPQQRGCMPRLHRQETPLPKRFRKNTTL